MSDVFGARTVQFSPKHDKLSGFIIDSISICEEPNEAYLVVSSGQCHVRCWPPDSVDKAMSVAHRGYGVPREEWEKQKNQAPENAGQNNGNNGGLCDGIFVAVEAAKRERRQSS